MKAVVAAFNQEKALVGDFSVITNLRMELFEALVVTVAAVFGANHENKLFGFGEKTPEIIGHRTSDKTVKNTNICNNFLNFSPLGKILDR